ncbi:glycosyltransferase family 2 protein [Desertivirga arenae]|uniref:glycosyltransferase family 2 protein n=1 Tax=Desertivirga arenae TaxID=2810309 RepID=UPI001A968EDF|nr:glycosyltransferase [Pedobacter sp. SYSU D00823]
MKDDQNQITLSVCCITYNHEKYIAECIESLVEQKTTFNYEVVIGEDCSTDNTRQIIQSYCEKYPDKIKLITSNKNVGAVNNQVRVLKALKGKYIAMCDGDDFWTDPDKLQKQVDFLESNTDVVICCTYSRVIDDDDNLVYEPSGNRPFEYNYQDLLEGKREETRISSAVIRNTTIFRQMLENDWYYKSYGTDVLIKLYMTGHTGGKIYVIPEITSCYRLHLGGIYSMVNPKARKRKLLNDFNILVNHFPYDSQQKKQLLRKYLREFFVFELKDSKVRKALATISSLI